MRIGIDLDNTIVCYDGIFHRTARDRGLLEADVAVTKGAVRDYLRATAREPLWTEMQGYVYGPGMTGADPFPGVWDFIKDAQGRGVDIKIVSHKTRHPFAGPPYDLHRSALAWLQHQAALHEVRLQPGEDIHLELTKQAKLQRIGALACDWFIDDLPEFLGEPDFPKSVNRILFDPAAQYAPSADMRRVGSWDEITAGFFGAEPWTPVP